MTGISFIIATSGTNDSSLNDIIDSIEILSIPEYQIILVGGLHTTINRARTTHIPFDETLKPKAWLTRKKNLGVQASIYDVVVVMHDYYVFDSNWYTEFEKFGLDWDICVHQGFHSDQQGGIRANGWRAEFIPGYPDIPYCMTIPWDIDCFVPYMPIQGAYWVAKKHVMLEQPLDEKLLWGDSDDIEWSSRVVPGWLGQKINQNDYKIVSNPNCITRFNKIKPTYPGNPNWAQMEKDLEHLWSAIRNGQRRPGIFYYDKHKIAIY